MRRQPAEEAGEGLRSAASAGILLGEDVNFVGRTFESDAAGAACRLEARRFSAWPPAPRERASDSALVRSVARFLEAACG
jgi:hypothetical protein